MERAEKRIMSIESNNGRSWWDFLMPWRKSQRDVHTLLENVFNVQRRVDELERLESMAAAQSVKDSKRIEDLERTVKKQATRIGELRQKIKETNRVALQAKNGKELQYG